MVRSRLLASSSAPRLATLGGDRFEFFLYDFHNWNWNKNPETCSSCFSSLIARWSSLVYLFLYSPLDRVAFSRFFFFVLFLSDFFSGSSSFWVWGFGVWVYRSIFCTITCCNFLLYIFVLAVCLFVCWRCEPGGLIFCEMASWPFGQTNRTVSLFVFNFWTWAVGGAIRCADKSNFVALSYLPHQLTANTHSHTHTLAHTLTLWWGCFALEFPDSRYSPDNCPRRANNATSLCVCAGLFVCTFVGRGRGQSPRLRFLGFINLISCLAPWPLHSAEHLRLGCESLLFGLAVF